MPKPDERDARDGLSTHDELRRLAETLELETHLAAMRPLDRWRLFGPRLRELEAELELAEHAVPDELALLLKWLGGPRARLN